MLFSSNGTAKSWPFGLAPAPHRCATWRGAELLCTSKSLISLSSPFCAVCDSTHFLARHSLSCTGMQSPCALNAAFSNKGCFPDFTQRPMASARVRILQVLNGVPVKTGIWVFHPCEGFRALGSSYARCRQRHRGMPRNGRNGRRRAIPVCQLLKARVVTWVRRVSGSGREDSLCPNGLLIRANLTLIFSYFIVSEYYR